MYKVFNLSRLAVVCGSLTIIQLFSACSAPKDDSSAVSAQEVVNGYADLVYNTYSDALGSAKVLQAAVESFLAQPSDSSLRRAQQAWLEARRWYAQTEGFRFYDGPIDNGAGGVEGLLNAWPLDEAYVDYVQGAPSAGIISNVTEFPVIDRPLLVSLNEKGGEENISCGYHAVEFMLWGQDLDSTAAGHRPYTDFISGNTINERRRTYLQMTTDLLVEHLSMLVEAWTPNKQGNYRSQFVHDSAAASLQKIITGMGVLAKVELAGERMFTAYDNADQEDEQSCFSDNTREDLVFNLRSIRNIYTGTYVRMEGDTITVPSIQALLREQDAAVEQALSVQLEQTTVAFNEIPGPFDRAIVEPAGREKVMRAITHVQQLGDHCAEAAQVLGLQINVSATE